MNIEETTAGSEPTFGDLADPNQPVVSVSRDYPNGHHFPWHRQGRSQLVFASAGVMTVATAAAAWIVPPQRAMWVPAGTMHEVHANGPLATRTLYMAPTVTARLPAGCCVLDASPLLREAVNRVVSLEGGEQQGGPAVRLFAVILDELEREKPAPLELPLPRDPRLAGITDCLRADPADGRTLSQFARLAEASERTVARRFLKETGMTFGQWRRQLRLMCAITLLCEGQPVTTVAGDLGYHSLSAFIAMFRQALGASPGRYLALHGRGAH